MTGLSFYAFMSMANMPKIYYNYTVIHTHGCPIPSPVLRYIIIAIIQSCTGKYHKFVAFCIVTSASTSNNPNSNNRNSFSIL